MKAEITDKSDIIVIGSGLAGLCAAVKAAESGGKVTIISKGKLFSGSSFYPGTWGLGLIAPVNRNDEKDLIDTILSVGQGMADEKLVAEFVKNINPSLNWLINHGVKLKEAENSTQKDFIPCFDHKHRKWHGLLSQNLKDVFEILIKNLNIKVIENAELVDIIKTDDKVSGILVYKEKFEILLCKSLILATGGFSTLFSEHITTDDVTASTHFLALKSGCELINMEFMQIMPAYYYPCYKTIVNEKVLRYVNIHDDKGTDLLKKYNISDEIMDLRSAHGPFTSRLPSKYVDLMISKYNSENGVLVTYKNEIKENMSEFAKTYFEWLQKNKNLTVNDEIHVKMFAHASNGGIKIDENAFTGVNGLFACGESTGGMHGADRIGGLSTANGLVFSLKAGESAVNYAKSVSFDEELSYDLKNLYIKNVCDKEKIMTDTMYRYALVSRNEDDLKKAISILKELITEKEETKDEKEIKKSKTFYSRINLAMCILKAELLRKESRGSHFREDYPTKSEKYNKRIVIKCENDKIVASFSN